MSIPIQLFLLSFSLKRIIPIIDELTITPILTKGKTIELDSFGSFKAFKKNTKEKKLGIPKIIPQNRLFNCSVLFEIIDFPDRMRIPLILAKKNNVIKNK